MAVLVVETPKSGQGYARSGRAIGSTIVGRTRVFNQLLYETISYDKSLESLSPRCRPTHGGAPLSRLKHLTPVVTDFTITTVASLRATPRLA